MPSTITQQVRPRWCGGRRDGICSKSPNGRTACRSHRSVGMLDVLIAGAGPAGCIAGIALARAGARVLMVDRARFPRAKLCGDSLNPGALALLRRLGLAGYPERHGVPAEGMIVTGANGARIEARYPRGMQGRLVSRADFDAWLLEQAAASGVWFEDRARVIGPVFASDDERRVAGVRIDDGRRGVKTITAPVTIAADGRRSTLAFGLGLSHHPKKPRRWAVGAYFEGVCGLSSFGEMHIRSGHYIGIAPLPGGVANACFVAPGLASLPAHRDLGTLLMTEIGRDPVLGPRFATARLATRPIALGPLAVDAKSAGMPGLLLAGDAAGFIDPMTGDGLYFAIRGGELAAQAAGLVLSGEMSSSHGWLTEHREREFRWKRYFNRSLRQLVDHSWAVALASRLGAVYPAAIGTAVSIAGDVNRAG